MAFPGGAEPTIWDELQYDCGRLGKFCQGTYEIVGAHDNAWQ